MSVDLLAFSFAVGSATGHLDFKGAPFQIMQKLKELKKKHGRKMTIRVYLEGARDTAARNRVTADHLAKAGIIVKMGATHAKGFCVDGRYLLIGSTNLTGQSIFKNNETNLLLDDKKASGEFGKYFEHLWNGGGHGGVKLRKPLLPDGTFKKTLLAMINGAKKRLEFSIYFFSQKDIEAALIRAHKRGVQVTGFINQHRTFGLDDVRQTRKTISRLREAGLDDLHFDQPNMFTHSKYMIKDRGELLLGSGNWLDRDVTVHPQLYIHLTDAALAKRLAKHLAKQIAKQAAD